MMTCTDFQAILPDYLEARALAPAQRAAADRHASSCPACSALADDLLTIAARAKRLPPLEPTRDLWRRIESEIESPVVALPGLAAAARKPTWRRFAAAASLLVATTAGLTYVITSRGPGTPAVPDSAATVASTGPSSRPAAVSPTIPSAVSANVPPTLVVAARHPGASETFDREIASLRTLVDERRGELDPVTVAVVQKNLQLIDRAIAESKNALAKDPASVFLTDRLTHAYETKLQVMRALATRPSRS